MPLSIPVGNRIIGQKLGSTDATIRGRMEQFPAVLSDAAALTSGQLNTMRANAIASGYANFRAIAYINVNDLNVSNVSQLAAHKQLITDNPQYVLKTAGLNGLPLVPTVAYGQMMQPCLSRRVVDGSGRTYADAYMDIIWADYLGTTYNWDGAYIDEFIPHLRCNGKWSTTYSGTVVGGSTTTNIKTSGFTVTGSASWGRFKDDTTTVALRGVFFATNSSTATDVPLQVTLPATPAAGDTFELLNALTAQFTAGQGFTTYNADLFRDGSNYNEGSGAAAAEVMYVQQLAIRRLKGLATAAAKPNFVVIGNLGAGAGRLQYIPQLVNDGMMHGFGLEGFVGKSYVGTARAAINNANELANMFGDASALSPIAFPMVEGYGASATDYAAMRNGYALAMMTNCWYGTGLSTAAQIADEYLVPLSISAAIDPPQNDRQANGCYLRRYAAGAAIYNPSSSTISGITVPGYRKLNAAVGPYTGQDTAFNDGASTFSLPAQSGAILVAG